MNLSVIIPVYNERENIASLLEAIGVALGSIEHEVILVDDGSTDGTVDEVLKHSKSNTKLLVFARNFGQTSALAAGIEAAEGEYIATLDGDLQNDPSDIPLMLKKLEEEKLDIVAGIRKNRQDGFILRKLPSKIANFLIRYLTKVRVQDYGCTLKIFRASLAKQLDLYGELHRFIPILGSIYGAKIGEVEVKHHPRKFGVSKYGLGRTLRVLSDLLLMLFFTKYRQKPMHFFGTLGIGMFLIGSLIEFYLLILKISGENIGHRPLFYIGIFLIIMSVQFITVGFLSELMMRTYFESQNKKPYIIARKFKGDLEIY